MWISRFCHALRLTIAVDKALTTKCFLDNTLMRTSHHRIPVLQGYNVGRVAQSMGLTDGSERGSAGHAGARPLHTS